MRRFARVVLILVGALAAAVATLAAAEVGIRATRGCLAKILEEDGDDEVRYRLRAGARVRFHGASISVDENGLRRTPRGTAKGNGAQGAGGTVLFVGNSHVFGIAVDDDQTIPAYVARARGDLVVLNGGVPGYDLRQKAASLENRAEALAPDTVLFFLNWGDFVPSSSGLEMRPATPFAAPFVRSCAVRGLARRVGLEGFLVAGPPPPPAYGETAAREAIGRAREAARKAKASLVVVLFPAPYDWSDYPGASTHALFRRAAEAEGVPVVDLLEELADEDPAPFLSYDGTHANAAGNARYAEAVLSAVLR